MSDLAVRTAEYQRSRVWAMTPIIPPELILEILRCVADRRNTFSACCLVCRTWRQFAQPFLFSEIQLTLESDCAFWNQKFSAYPHLADFVTILDLWGHGRRQVPDAVLDPFLEVPPPMSSYAGFQMSNPCSFPIVTP